MFHQQLRHKCITSALATLLILIAAGCSQGGSDNDSPVRQLPTNTTTDGVVNVVARTGPIVTVQTGEMITLDGSKSFTSSSDPLNFQWTLLSQPAASTAEFQDASAENPSFMADAPGSYVAQLVVSAEGINSRRAISLASASTPPEQPGFHDGLSSDCVNCHEGDQLSIPVKPATHIATSEFCATCHTATSIGFSVLHKVDHREVFGACSECHNGTLAVGKSDTHIPTNGECDDCHTTTSFFDVGVNGSFEHTGIVGGCSDCHNGSISTGKTPTPPHPATTSDCVACHTTESFLNAYPDHTAAVVLDNRCDSCHGVSATGPIVGHPETSVDCSACHGVATFSLDGVFGHRIDPALQSCESCHNDNNSINAPGKGSAVPSHIATTDDCGSCHNTTDFADAFVDHTGIVDDCASCHGVTASGKPVNHMPTLEDCSVCHTPGSFATGVYDHIDVVDNCESCHNNVITLGKLPSHLPTSEDCAVCHTTLTFTGATFDHQGIDTSNCALCHDDNISIGKHAEHLPTSLDCSSCHEINNFTSFAGIAFNHQGVDPNNCASCHATGIATPKVVNHIPTQQDCSSCHDSTSVFVSTTFLVTQHQDITRGCEGCHTSQFFANQPGLFKAADHLPTSQDCYLCHTNTTFTNSIFSHEGIAANCESCHDGSTNFVNLGALGKTPTPVHDNTNLDCSACHNTSNFADAFVDHASPAVLAATCESCHNGVDATGKDAKVNPPHVITDQDCGVCHTAGGAFAPAFFDHTGISDNCASCHNGTDAIGKTAKVNPDHIPTNDDCSVCHVTTSFAQANFEHQNIVDNCVSCHDGTTATGKVSNHVPTNADCVDCHQTTGFVPATFDHIGIVDNCASCHDAGYATPKSTTHLGTNQDCAVCHTTRAFIPANFDHTGIVDNCASCHNGTTAIGTEAKTNPDHIATNLDCSSCHTTATFAGGTWTHDASSIGRCDECHSVGGGATFKPVDHLETTVQCDVCHITNGWAPTSFSHDPQGNYPGDHRRDPGCTTCHGPSVNATFSYPSPQYAPFCAGCHARDFDRKGDHIGGENGTIEQNKDCSNGGRGCHRVTDSKFD